MTTSVVVQDDDPEASRSLPSDVSAAPLPSIHRRSSLAISHSRPHHVLLLGDNGFDREVSRFYTSEESIAAERLQLLKAELRAIPGDAFWAAATRGFTDLTGSQFAFIFKRESMNYDE